MKLTDEQLAFFGENGYLPVAGVLSAGELADLRAAYDRIFAATEKPSSYRNLGQKEGEEAPSGAVLQIIDMWRLDPAFARVLYKEPLLDIVERVVGGPGLRLYHDQALYKEPGGGHTPWHQDQYYWPLEGGHTVTMWMPLVDASAEMGTMTFASPSHREGYLGRLEISDESEAYFTRFVGERGMRLTRAGAMAAGDATFHSGWTLHSAPGNSTDRVREVMTVIYFADGTHVVAPDNPHREADLAAWIPGGEPGQPAASALNPLVYDAAG